MGSKIIFVTPPWNIWKKFVDIRPTQTTYGYGKNAWFLHFGLFSPKIWKPHEKVWNTRSFRIYHFFNPRFERELNFPTNKKKFKRQFFDPICIFFWKNFFFLEFGKWSKNILVKKLFTETKNWWCHLWNVPLWIFLGEKILSAKKKMFFSSDRVKILELVTKWIFYAL
jgi:hypothetical protein